MRTHHSQLPKGDELEKMLAQEGKREVLEEKKGVHFADIELFRKFCRKIGVDTSEMTLGHDLTESSDIGSRVLENIIEKLKGENLGALRGDFDELFDYLAEEDPLEKADIIFVFGSQLPYRAEKAIELYKAGLAPKILFTGRGPFYLETRPEAEVFYDMAIEAGIPESAMILEPESVNIVDNVKRSLNLLDEREIPYESLILIMVPYGQRRGYGEMQKYLHKECKLIRCNSANFKYDRDVWFSFEEGRRVILNEYIKIWLCQNGDVI